MTGEMLVEAKAQTEEEVMEGVYLRTVNYEDPEVRSILRRMLFREERTIVLINVCLSTIVGFIAIWSMMAVNWSVVVVSEGTLLGLSWFPILESEHLHRRVPRARLVVVVYLSLLTTYALMIPDNNLLYIASIVLLVQLFVVPVWVTTRSAFPLLMRVDEDTESGSAFRVPFLLSIAVFFGGAGVDYCVFLMGYPPSPASFAAMVGYGGKVLFIETLAHSESLLADEKNKHRFTDKMIKDLHTARRYSRRWLLGLLAHLFVCWCGALSVWDVLGVVFIPVVAVAVVIAFLFRSDRQTTKLYESLRRRCGCGTTKKSKR